MPDKEPQKGKRYVTVREALDMYDIPERTLRRWIKPSEKKGQKKDPLVGTLSNSRGQVRIDLDDLERAMSLRHMSASPLRKQVQELQACYEQLEQEVAHLKQQVKEMAALDQEQILQVLTSASVQENQNGAEAVPSQLLQQISQMLAKLPRKGPTRSKVSGAKKRGYSEDTIHLVDFVKLHKANLWDIKQLYRDGKIALAVYQRESEAKRNKREWWITPDQHLQLVRYWQQHEIPYHACPQCEQERVAHVEVTEVG
jgi:hypothetical protein